MSVCVCVCVCPSVHFWRTVKTPFCPHFKSWMSKIFRDSESFGKRSGLTIGNFFEWIYALLIFNHLVNFARIRRLYNTDQEVIQQGSEGYTTRIRRLYNKDHEVISRIFLVSVLLSASIERRFFSCMQDF